MDQIIILYTLTLYRVACDLYLNTAGEKRESFMAGVFFCVSSPTKHICESLICYITFSVLKFDMTLSFKSRNSSSLIKFFNFLFSST